ncbi:lytic transglycosylase domain-containing protein [Actinoplanes subtropicus]|uniref:lytic transglycosylase domain-containing protein n=1 Tax=Actinoplanes subtropicus TaxID=543632 RepID=UPI0004C34395|nr:lytic transglycosylase domain-containing protein [Actinoplanes subtropicus]
MGHRGKLLAAAIALVVAAGCGLTGHDKGTAAAPPSVDPVGASSTPSEEPTSADLSAESPSPTPSRTTTKPKPKATEPTAPPFWSQLPACAHYDKTTPVAKGKVKAALKSAAGRVYWQTEAPTLKLNYPLVKAIAWQESGWKSNIHNCDGGAGIMQVMPATVEMINQRFGLTYDPSKYQDNAYVGANYLAWLTKWASYNYFNNSYDLSAGKCKSHTSWCLLNVVISGYNAGQGGIEAAAATKTLPNPEYVAAVRALMTRCQCDQY